MTAVMDLFNPGSNPEHPLEQPLELDSLTRSHTDEQSSLLGSAPRNLCTTIQTSTSSITMGTQPCKGCGVEISDSATECICGEKNPHSVTPPPSSPLPEPEPEPEPDPEPDPSSSPPMSPDKEE